MTGFEVGRVGPRAPGLVGTSGQSNSSEHQGRKNSPLAAEAFPPASHLPADPRRALPPKLARKPLTRLVQNPQ